MANGKSKQGAVRRTCLQVLLAKHEVTSIDLKCCDRHAEIPKYRESYKKVTFNCLYFLPYMMNSTQEKIRNIMVNKLYKGYIN